jgi:proton-dependent oligopeptide transporter, POT family
MRIRSKNPNLHRHPPGLAVLFFTEMWERFSFYCMLSILSLYMDESLHFSMMATSQIYGLYTGLVYFTPLIGGWLADRYFGFRKSIIMGGIAMGIGHLCLAFPPLPTFFLGLICLIVGNGMFKPNISSILAGLYHEMPEKLDDAYNIFYMGVNLGALISPFVAFYLRTNYGWHYAFGAAGVGMVIAILVFTIFRKHVAKGEVHGVERSKAHQITLTHAQEKQRIFALVFISIVVVVFWMAFEQSGLTMTFWARDNTITEISPELFQAVNPIFILMFTPLLIMGWTWLRRRGKEPATASKIALGMLLGAAAGAIMMVAALSGGDHGRVNVSWLVSAYAVITVAEICLSPMGLSLVAKLAPPRMAGFWMGGWFAVSAIGSYLAGLIGSFWDRMNHSTFFAFLTVSSLIAFGFLLFVLRRLHRTIEEAERMLEDAAHSA